MKLGAAGGLSGGHARFGVFALERGIFAYFALVEGADKPKRESEAQFKIKRTLP